MMNYQEFVDKWNGKSIDFDGYYGFQCMDLAHQYCVDVVGKDFAPAPAAKDVWNQEPQGYDKIPNSPEGVPSKGDVVIWGSGVGPYGHIAIFDHGDNNSFTSFDQNWPVGSLCHLQPHNYTGVLGWFHPQSVVIPQEIVITDQTTIPQIDNMEVQAIKSKLNDLERDLKACRETPQKPPETGETNLANIPSTLLFRELVKRILGR